MQVIIFKDIPHHSHLVSLPCSFLMLDFSLMTFHHAPSSYCRYFTAKPDYLLFVMSTSLHLEQRYDVRSFHDSWSSRMSYYEHDSGLQVERRRMEVWRPFRIILELLSNSLAFSVIDHESLEFWSHSPTAACADFPLGISVPLLSRLSIVVILSK